jgi:hypothetical protein
VPKGSATGVDSVFLCYIAIKFKVLLSLYFYIYTEEKP